ncbi:Cyclin-like protein, partial [Dioscorea alata]
SESSVARRGGDTRDLDLDSDLACSERLSGECSGSSEYSTCNEMTLSDFDSDLFLCGSSSYCSSSIYLDSTDDFSDHFTNNNPSPTFAFFLDLRQQLNLFSTPGDSDSSSRFQDQSPIEFTVMRFEEEDDEEGYKGLRRRERRNGAPTSYADEYTDETINGDLILQQRLLMVNWIIEHAKAMELQNETIFLGVSLLDRFLSKGYFTTDKNLQLLGISCITLATRIEENQPYNNIRQRSFTVGSNVYSRSEVVSMEWLVMEVLKFQCFPPTIHNFLWFYLKASGADAEVEALARYLAVLSLLDHERLSFWPSTVAASLVILASLATDHDSSCHLVMETHVRTKNDDLPECIQSLEWLVKYAC